MLLRCKICASYLPGPAGLSNSWGACATILITKVEFSSHAFLKKQFLCVNLEGEETIELSLLCSQSAEQEDYFGYRLLSKALMTDIDKRGP